MFQRNVLKAMVAGFVATVALSALMLMKSKMGVIPELDVIAMLSRMMGNSPPAVGCFAHFMIGTVVWGALFAWLNRHIPGDSYLTKGVVFGIAAWVVMMIGVMPMAGAGLFGMKFGVMAPMMTLVLHVIFGAVLGGVYGLQRPVAQHA
ncbi:MAG: hypothetical protein JSR72_20270 [Proteobacteria bacterium]|nr:hypothetical protein [Pseudomonadota bacterium]